MICFITLAPQHVLGSCIVEKVAAAMRKTIIFQYLKDKDQSVLVHLSIQAMYLLWDYVNAEEDNTCIGLNINVRSLVLTSKNVTMHLSTEFVKRCT
jgi:hypothetical protein